MLESGYFRAKMAQEELIKKAGVPYSILRATQFSSSSAPLRNPVPKATAFA